MSYPRNAVSPERVDIGSVIQISDGAVQTSGVAVKVLPQGASESAGGGTVGYSADGVVHYIPTQAETDYTSFILIASKAGSLPASKTVVTEATSTAGKVAVASIDTDAINAASVKADAVTKIQAGLSTYAGGDTSGTTTLLARLTSTRAGLLDNLSNLDVAVSVIQSLITTLNNLSAKANWFGYPLLEVPDAGTRAYVFELIVRDDEDKLVNLDSLPAIALTNAAGTDRSALITTGVANPSTGRYTITITVGTSTTNESLKLTATGAIGAETRYASYGTQVVDYDTATLINQILTTLGTAGSGLTAIGDARLDNLDAEISSRLAPTVSGRTLNVSAGGAGDAELNTGGLLAALGLDAGNLDEQLADILAASGGGGGGGGLTAEQNALLVSIAQWAARNNGGPMHYTGNVGDGGVLELTVGDDHETVMENDLPIVVKDPGGLFRAKLVASGSTLAWSAGQDGVGGLITGTVSTPTYDSGTELTTIVVQVPNCAAAGNITTPFKWQLKRTSGGKIKTELQGTLRLNADMS